MAAVIRNQEELKRYLERKLEAAEHNHRTGDAAQQKWSAGVMEGLETALDALDNLASGRVILARDSCRRSSRPPPALNALQEGCLERIWDSTAWRKYEDGDRYNITFVDACNFWGLGFAPKGKTIDIALHKEFTNPLEAILTKLEGAAEVVTSAGRSLTTADLDKILQLDAYLQQQYLKHLKLLRAR